MIDVREERRTSGSGWICPQLRDGLALRRADLRLALDRPDRLELEIIDVGDHRASSSEERGPRVGAPLELGYGGERPLFRGRAERLRFRMDAEGSAWEVVAWADYEARRRSLEPAAYYEMSDAEIARRLAVELGLRPRVEPTRRVHDRLERRGDPLAFLRRRAAANGFELAVTAGELHFAALPLPVETPPFALDLRRGVRSLEIEERARLGRGGRLELLGDPRWRPLAVFELAAGGPGVAGRYRVQRVRHRVEVGEFSTVIEFLEEGLSLAAWRRGAAPGISDEDS